MRRVNTTLVLTATLLFGCTEGGFRSTATSEPDDYTTSSLTETQPIPQLGFQIDYPGGWALTSNESSLNLAESYEDLQLPMAAPSGYRVRIESADPAGLAEAGYDPATGLQGLLRFNAAAFGWPESIPSREITVGGSSALAVETLTPDGSAALAIAMGELNGRYFIMGLEAPTEASLDSFLPVWNAMLASVRNVE